MGSPHTRAPDSCISAVCDSVAEVVMVCSSASVTHTNTAVISCTFDYVMAFYFLALDVVAV